MPRAAYLCSLAISGILAAGAPSLAQERALNLKSATISEKPAHIAKPNGKAKGRRGKKHRDAALGVQDTRRTKAKSYSRTNADETNTWLIFGFTEGSDVGAKGEWTLSHDSIVRTTAHGPSLGAWDGGIGIGYSLSDRAVISLTATPSLEGNADGIRTSYRTDGVSSHALGASASFKYQLFRRDEAPMGLAIQISPYWQHITAGPLEQNSIGSEVRVVADRVLVPDRWFAALNVAYQPHHDAYSDGSGFRKTTAEISGAVSRKVLTNLLVGAEVRLVSKFQGFAFDQWAGDAVYLGPTAFMLIGEQGYLGLAWSARITERGNVDNGQILDLDGFDRHQVRVKAGVSF
jgi:hypothetical protein